MYNLFLDDERTPKTSRTWVIVRSYSEAVNYVQDHGIPAYVSFDHDLADDKTGYDFAKWLGEEVVLGKHKMFEWNVHSANPSGAKNISEYLKFVERYINV